MSLEIHKNSQYITVIIREDILGPQLQGLQKCFAMAMSEGNIKAIVLDMVGMSACDDFCLKELAKEVQKLREHDIYVFVVRLVHSMQSKLQREGLSQLLIYRNNIEDALAEVGIETKSRLKLDLEFVKPILDSAVKVISLKSGLNCEAGQLFNKKEKDHFDPDFIAVLGIVSSTFNGSVAIAFQNVLFNLLAKDPDAAEELLMAIHSDASTSLAIKNHLIQQFIPMVVRGKTVPLSEIIPEPLLILPYSTAQGPFQIYVGLN